MRRVIVVLTDGLRPDALTPTHMPSLVALASNHAFAHRATTIRPSTTVAALATIATGLAPASHGLTEPGLNALMRMGRLRPMARELARAGLATHIVAGALGPVEQGVAWALASAAGVARFTSQGHRARDVAAAALVAATDLDAGVLFVYLSDCDRVGHAHGWMSREYLAAAAELDVAIGMLAHFAERDLVLVLADHGGGGVSPTDHDEPHALNDEIPLVLAGPGIERRRVSRPISILDIPPTICSWLGIDVPECYEGTPISEAFGAPLVAA